MMKAIDNGTINYKNEIFRKSIHLVSLSIPVTYYFIEIEQALSILIPLMVLAVFIDIARHYSVSINSSFNSIFGFLLREHEIDTKKKNLSGATYVLISAVVSILILPKFIFVSAFAILILSDIAAALIGRKYGKHKFLAKSFEGTLAFFIVACLVIILTPKYQFVMGEYLIGFAAALIGAIAENISYGWADDNLMIPITTGLSLWGFYAWFLPTIDVISNGVIF